MDETVNQLADNAYGRSKFAAEQLVLLGHFVPHPVVLRPCMVYGNTHKGNLPKMIKAIKRGLFPPLPEVHNRRAMVHVNDVVAAALLTANLTQAKGQIYIISDDHYYSTRQLYNWIRVALGKPVNNWSIPYPVLLFLAKIGDIVSFIIKRRFIFDSDNLQKLTGSAYYSSAKIKRELGYCPKHSLPTALDNIIAYLNTL